VVIEGTKNDNAKRTVELKDAPIIMELLARRVATLAPDALIFAPADQVGLIATLRNLPADQLDTACSAVGYRR
jgi:hypothetical protein